MGNHLRIRTACDDNGEAIALLARELDQGDLVLEADEAVDAGAWIAFEVLLNDGQLFLEGMGRCLEYQARAGRRHVRLGELQLDAAAELLFERIQIARDDLEHGGRHTAMLIELPPLDELSEEQTTIGVTLRDSYEDISPPSLGRAGAPAVARPLTVSPPPLPRVAELTASAAAESCSSRPPPLPGGRVVPRPVAAPSPAVATTAPTRSAPPPPLAQSSRRPSPRVARSVEPAPSRPDRSSARRRKGADLATDDTKAVVAPSARSRGAHEPPSAVRKGAVESSAVRKGAVESSAVRKGAVESSAEPMGADAAGRGPASAPSSTQRGASSAPSSAPSSTQRGASSAPSSAPSSTQRGVSSAPSSAPSSTPSSSSAPSSAPSSTQRAVSSAPPSAPSSSTSAAAPTPRVAAPSSFGPSVVSAAASSREGDAPRRVASRRRRVVKAPPASAGALRERGDVSQRLDAPMSSSQAAPSAASQAPMSSSHAEPIAVAPSQAPMSSSQAAPSAASQAPMSSSHAEPIAAAAPSQAPMSSSLAAMASTGGFGMSLALGAASDESAFDAVTRFVENAPPAEARRPSVRPSQEQRAERELIPFAPREASEETRVDTRSPQELELSGVIERRVKALLPRLLAEGRVRSSAELQLLAMRLGLDALEAVFPKE